MIAVRDVDVRLSGRSILEHVSCTVEKGELLGVIGPNGSGKTTLLRTVAGFVSRRSGHVRLDGTDVESMDRRSVSRRVAVVPQSTKLSFGFTVRDVVAMGRTPYRPRIGGGDPAGDAVVDRALERTAIEHLAERPVTDISGGEQRRVMIAQAVAQETPGLLLDEPTAGLDIGHRIDTMELITELVEDGVAAMAAIHDLDLAARYCDRLLLLGDGTPVATGTPSDVLRPEPLETAFGASVVVADDPVTGAPRVIPQSATPGDAGRVAVLGHAGSAVDIIGRLHRAGYDLTLGVPRRGDQDVAVGDALGIETVVAPSVGPIPDETIARMRSACDAADLVVLSDVAVDETTMPLLDLAMAAEDLLVVEDRPFPERDHTDGTATTRYRRLHGTVVDPENLLAGVKRVVRGTPKRADREV